MPLRAGNKVGGIVGARLRQRRVITDQHAIGPAVIVALELEDFGAAGVGASQAQRDQYRLRAGVREGDEVGTRHGGLNALGHANLQRVLRAEGMAARQLGLHRLVDGGMAVAQDERPPGHREVEVAEAIHIGQIGPLSMFNEQRLWLDRRAERAADAPCQRSPGAHVEFMGLGWHARRHPLLLSKNYSQWPAAARTR